MSLEEALEIWSQRVYSVGCALASLVFSLWEEALEEELLKSDSRNVLCKVLLDMVIDLFFSQLTVDALHRLILETWVQDYVLPNEVRSALGMSKKQLTTLKSMPNNIRTKSSGSKVAL